MDLFKFVNPTSRSKLEQGELINGLTNVTWIERYRDAGEFEFIGLISSNLRELLPIGTFVSHVETEEVMIVESHEINEKKGTPSEIKITGRSYETFLENRVVGVNRVFPVYGTLPEYILSTAYLPMQIIKLLEDHLISGKVIDENNALQNFNVLSIASIQEPISQDISLKRGNLYTHLLDLLAVEDMGIRSVRPGNTFYGFPSINSGLIIHRGTDRSDKVIFSNEKGDIDNADYFWSNKNIKNCALITGRWVDSFVTTGPPGIDRRIMYIDGTDIDGSWNYEPPASVEVIINYYLITRGLQALAKQNRTVISKVEAGKNLGKYVYGIDFGVGDIVMVDGDYKESSKMRVSEYVRIQDKDGDFGYPTLTVI